MTRRFPALIGLALLAALSACATPEPEPTFPEITFTHEPKIRLDVAKVEFVQKYVPPQRSPNVEHLFAQLPSAVVRRWAEERIEPMGITRVARVTLVDASVIEVPLAKKEGLKDLFWKEQTERYDATLEVRIEIIDANGKQLAFARSVAKRSQTVDEDVSPNERQQIWFELTEAVTKDLDTELERVIRKYLAEYVR